jgi:hypothetical protein
MIFVKQKHVISVIKILNFCEGGVLIFNLPQKLSLIKNKKP